MTRKTAAALADAASTDAGTAALAAELAIDAAARAKNAPQQLAEREQAHGVERARMELASEEGSWLGRLSPRHNAWPELVELDAKIAALDAEQNRALADVQALEQELREAEEHDRVTLGHWHANGGAGERPQPTAPAVAERLEQRRADSLALPDAAAEAVAEKIEFVRRHRGRLVKRAEQRVQELDERYLSLIAALEEVRGELVDARITQLWALLYPSAAAAHEPPQALALGLRKPVVEALGLPLYLQPAQVWKLLRADAELIPTAIADEQKKQLAGSEERDPRAGFWSDTDQGRGREETERLEARERHRREYGSYPA